jgi:RNA polymerase sigma-70 factor (ECF subfamily)
MEVKSLSVMNNRPDDIHLIRLIAKEQSDALNELYDRYNRLIFSVAFAIVGDRNVAEEITLDVFVQVWKHASTYQPDRAKVSTWLIAIARHHSIDVLRWQNSRPEADPLTRDETSLQNGPTVHHLEEHIDLSLQREQIRKALEHLPDDQRKTLILAFFKGYTQSEIAEALEQPLGTIKTRIRLGMQKLRKLLEED